jgi:peptide/nickel transport system substrate-binding protein
MKIGKRFRNGLLGLASAGALACLPSAVRAQVERPQPQYGGTLNIGMVYVALAPLSWDPADWPWKFQQDTGLMYEQLFAADLTKSKRNGGPYSFVPDSWLPTDATRGDLPRAGGGRMIRCGLR